MECCLCNVSGEGIEFYKGIHKKFGIISVCKKCLFREKMPLFEKKEINLEEVNRRLTVRERLSRLAKVDLESHGRRVEKVKSLENVKLKDIVEKNLKVEHVPKELVGDLVDNFNWVIMRKRRMMKLSRDDLGEAIQESSIIIEALEKGSLPRNYPILIKKIENYLGINLFVGDKKINSADILAETKTPRGIMISDLKKTFLEREVEDRTLNEIAKGELNNWGENKKDVYEDSISLDELNLEKVKEIVGEPIEEKEGASYKKKLKDSELKDELSQKDIEDLIFGNK
jgi:ribosome-binding protein aMBF1 (putative translation factor)